MGTTLGITMSLTGEKDLCHIGKKCIKKCHQSEFHKEGKLLFNQNAPTETVVICHVGECYPKD